MHAGWGGGTKRTLVFCWYLQNLTEGQEEEQVGCKLIVRRWYSATGAAASSSRVFVGLTAAEQLGGGGKSIRSKRLRLCGNREENWAHSPVM